MSSGDSPAVATSRPNAPKRSETDVMYVRSPRGNSDSPTTRGAADSLRNSRSPGSPSSSGSQMQEREKEEARRREFDKASNKDVFQPLDPRLLVSGIEAVGNNLFGFFQQTFAIPLGNLPQWLDDRETLRRHIFNLDGEMQSLKDQLVLARDAVEATKAERARGASETMKHWRQHRREVEKLKEDQAELVAGLQDLRAQSELREQQHALELRQARQGTALAKRSVVELTIQLEGAQQHIAELEAKVAGLEGQVRELGGTVAEEEWGDALEGEEPGAEAADGGSGSGSGS